MDQKYNNRLHWNGQKMEISLAMEVDLNNNINSRVQI